MLTINNIFVRINITYIADEDVTDEGETKVGVNKKISNIPRVNPSHISTSLNVMMGTTI